MRTSNNPSKQHQQVHKLVLIKSRIKRIYESVDQSLLSGQHRVISDCLL